MNRNPAWLVIQLAWLHSSLWLVRQLVTYWLVNISPFYWFHFGGQSWPCQSVLFDWQVTYLKYLAVYICGLVCVSLDNNSWTTVHDLWPTDLACCTILTLSESSVKVKVIGQSSRSQEETVAKVVSKTSSVGFIAESCTKPFNGWNIPL